MNPSSAPAPPVLKPDLAAGRRAHFEWVAAHHARARRAQAPFHAQLARHFARIILPGESILELGCGPGSVLNALAPAAGLGVDFSPGMVAQARAGAPPGVRYEVADVMAGPVAGVFDHLILDYLVGYLPDVQEVLARLQANAHPRTRLHVTSLNTLWKPVLRAAVAFGEVMRQPESAWLSEADLVNLLELAGWEVVRREAVQLWPFDWPGFSWALNRVLVKLPWFRHLGITLALTARPRRPVAFAGEVDCTVVVPARNEAGNIRPALERIPVLGRSTEVIFVEGHSKDDTWAAIEREVAAYRGPLQVRALRQPGKGKWDAVRTGFEVARGEVLIIQDADLTAPPEDLPKFFAALADGTAEMANGSRLVYPMEDRAMRFLNLLGNKFFAWALSFVMRQPVKDSLCGTKAILRRDYARIRLRVAEWGEFDPFGDFNLLFGAASLGLRIRDVPVRYRDRTYGETNISRFRHGWMLLKMTWFGLWKLRLPGRCPR